MKKHQAALFVGVATCLAGAAFAARLLGEADGFTRTAREQVAQAANPAAAARRANGSQPLVPLGTLTLSGDVTPLAPQQGMRVYVTGGDRTYEAQVQGQGYSVRLFGRDLASTAMVKVEVHSAKVRYVSVLGSYGRLRALAGADGHLSLDEQPALRVSPYSTALALLSEHALGGVAARSDLEFERALRATTGAEVLTTTYLLESYTQGTEPLVPSNTTGYAMITPSRLQGYLTYDYFHPGARAYFASQPSVAGLKSLAELPDQLLLTGALHQDSPRTTDIVRLLQRESDGSYSLFEENALSQPRYTAALQADGAVHLQPLGPLARTYVNGMGQTVQRNYLGYTLRRLFKGAYYSHWSVRLEWEELIDGQSTTGSDALALTARDLATWKQADAWAGMDHALRSLPWLCVDPSVAELRECEYAQYQPDADTFDHLVNHGDKVDEQMQPLALADGPAMDHWTVDGDGALHVRNDDSDTVFWRVENPQREYGTVVYLSHSRNPLAADQAKVGVSFTISQQEPGPVLGQPVGRWKDTVAYTQPARYSEERTTIVTERRADGSGDFLDTPPGWNLDPFPRALHWSVFDEALFDRNTFFLSGTDETCAEVLLREPTCTEGMIYFRALYRVGQRYWGVYEGYRRVVDRDGNIAFKRHASQPLYYECVQGECLADTGVQANAARRPAVPQRAAVAKRVPVRKGYLLD